MPVMEAKSLFSESDVYKIFANIQEVYEFSLTLMSLLDAAVETATEEGTGVPAIGACFEDMAEVCMVCCAQLCHINCVSFTERLHLSTRKR